MMRLRERSKQKEIRGTFQWFPLVAEDGRCFWPEKFDTPEKIDNLRRSVANELAWQQEYLLNIISIQHGSSGRVDSVLRRVAG